MSFVRDAFASMGNGTTISLFVVIVGEKPALRMSFAYDRPEEVRVYALEDELGLLPNASVIEYDAYFNQPPRALREYMIECLREAMSAGAVVAWFGFEGSFHFEHVLDPELASSFPGVADCAGIAVATEEAEIRSDAWRTRIAEARARLLLRSSSTR
jgi:hypothetical protein